MLSSQQSHSSYFVRLVPMMVAMMVMAVVTVAAVPIIRPVVRVAIVRPVVVPIRVISVVPRSDPNAEEDSSVGTWRRSKGQSPRHQYN
jgi:hypothetical protein